MRYFWLAGVMMGIAALPSAHAQSKEETCAAYARRAVQQYQLMKSHPGCDAHLDALSWRDDYAYHYNGCMTFGKIATTLSEQGRDGHLRACGAITDSGSAPAASGAPAAGTASATDTASASPASAPAASSGDLSAPARPASTSGGASYPYAGAQGAIASMAVAAGVSAAPLALVAPATGSGAIGCPMPPALQAYLTRQVMGFGLATQLNGTTLTYHGSPTIAMGSQNANTASIEAKAELGEYALETTPVTRPQFYSMCRGIPAVSLLGPWIAPASAGSGPRYFWVDVGGHLSWQQISPEAANAFLGGGPSKATTQSATGAKPATPTAAGSASPAKSSKPKK